MHDVLILRLFLPYVSLQSSDTSWQFQANRCCADLVAHVVIDCNISNKCKSSLAMIASDVVVESGLLVTPLAVIGSTFATAGTVKSLKRSKTCFVAALADSISSVPFVRLASCSSINAMSDSRV